MSPSKAIAARLEGRRDHPSAWPLGSKNGGFLRSCQSFQDPEKPGKEEKHGTTLTTTIKKTRKLSWKSICGEAA